MNALRSRLTPARAAWVTFVVALLAGHVALGPTKVDADVYGTASSTLMGLLLVMVVEHRLFAGGEQPTAAAVYVLLLLAAGFALFLAADHPTDPAVQRLAVLLIGASFLGGGAGLVAMAFREEPNPARHRGSPSANILTVRKSDRRGPAVADYTVKRINDMEAIAAGSFKRARGELGVEAWGMQVFDIPPNIDLYPEHDHAESGQEEVYVTLRGSAEITIDGETVTLEPEVMVRVGPEATRKVVTHDDPIRMLVIGGTPGKAYELSEAGKLGGPDPGVPQQQG